MIKRVYIEITNRCNLRCSFCSFHHRSFHEMSLKEFEHILQQVKPVTSYIYLHVQGEPFLHSQFDEILSLCDLYDMKVQLVTNGILLKNHMDLSHPSIRKVSISIHSIDETNVNEKEYMDTILQFIEKNHTKFYIDCRFWLKDALKPKAQYCLDTFIQKYDVEISNSRNVTLEKNVFLGFENRFEWPVDAKNSFVDGTCLGAKNMLAILSNGQVSICCLDSEGQINLGNIYFSSLNSILESDLYQSILTSFANNKCLETLCEQCTYRNRFR